MSTPTLQKGRWYLLKRHTPESRAGSEKTETFLVQITSSPNGGGFLPAHVIDTGANIRMRPIYFGGVKLPDEEWGVEIPLEEKGGGWHKYFSHFFLQSEAEAKQYCDQHDLSLLPHEQQGFRERVRHFFGG